MGEYRPYRVTNQRAQARLTQVKLISVLTFIGLALLINWIATQHAARLFGYSRARAVADRWPLRAMAMARLVVALAWRGATRTSLGPVHSPGGLSLADARRPDRRNDYHRTISAPRNVFRPARVCALGNDARHSCGRPHRTASLPSAAAATIG